MPTELWVDHYATLQLDPSADRETVGRAYRLLVKRYHPDNRVTGDAGRFDEVRKAFEILSDLDARAAYDARYEQARGEQWRIFDQSTAGDDREEDQRLLYGILALLYQARQHDPDNAGMASSHLERMLGVPPERLDFPLWYLRQRRYVEILETGLMAITVDGVDALRGDVGRSSPRRSTRRS